MKRVVIVGGSSGLGRSIGIGLAQRGTKVALLARRKDKVDAAALEAGDNAFGVACDATDFDSCQAAIDESAERMGGIDSIVYAAAIGPLVKLKDADATAWRSTFDTNVLGASLITRAGIGHVSKSAGNLLYMSTTGASYTPPWPGLAVYQVTKAALDKLVEAWRAEHPGVNFTRVTIGECPGGEGDSRTSFNEGWDMSLAGEVAPIWFARNYMGMNFIDIEHLIEVFHTLVHAGQSIQVPSITVIPRPPVPEGS